MQPSAANASYNVESPAALATAPPTTCPWVRVSRDGTMLVRNYLNMLNGFPGGAEVKKRLDDATVLPIDAFEYRLSAD